MTRRNKGIPAPLLPGCDRCGRPTHPSWLRFDGIGHICPPCQTGGQK